MSEALNNAFIKNALEAIPLLNADNFSLWRHRVETLLDLQQLRKELTTEQGVLTEANETILRSVLSSKLDSSIHANVINPENQQNAKAIWKSIISYFASAESSNRAWVYQEITGIMFNPNNI